MIRFGVDCSSSLRFVSRISVLILPVNTNPVTNNKTDTDNTGGTLEMRVSQFIMRKERR